MNFEELKHQWKENEEQLPELLPENLMVKSKSVIEKVRRNIRIEFFSQILGTLFVGYMMFKNTNTEFALFTYTLFSLALLFSIYYYVRFFIFYKKTYQIATNTKDGIFWFYNELRLYIELYRSHVFTLLSLGLAVGFIAGFVTNGEMDSVPIVINMDGDYWNGFIVLAICLLILIGFCELWIWIFYSKYLRNIKKIYDEIK
jgi:hypothetical protein